VKDQESLMAEFVKSGHHVFFLNQQINSYLPELCKSAGVTYEMVTIRQTRFTTFRIIYYWFQLLQFVRNNKVEVVYSHLEPANFIAVLVQYFVKARIIVVRHHLDLAKHIGIDQDLSYRLTYRLAKDIIAVSAAARRYMIEREKINALKIHHINLGYDFSVFDTHAPEKVTKIRSKLSGSIILISVGRLDSFKRPEQSIEVCRVLNEMGHTAHLFLLGSGEKEPAVKMRIAELGLQNHIELLGYVDNVMDYLKASDWLLHPSISESSCVVVKEAAVAELPVIACKGVGDFDDYLISHGNSVLVDRDHFAEEAVKEIVYFENNKTEKLDMGRKLKDVVVSNFDIRTVVSQYDQFHR
jgi:glycosyltransferase involved in cell wall biosynthesis